MLSHFMPNAPHHIRQKQMDFGKSDILWVAAKEKIAQLLALDECGC